jgi:hypothetical protein
LCAILCQTFAWYTQKTPLTQIRKRLIAADAPQKGSSIPRHIRWFRSSIQAILKSAKEYAYGFKTYSRAGQIFHIPVAPISDISTSKPTSLGMRIMRERTEAIGADYHISSTPGSGTCVEVIWNANPNVKLKVL